MIKINNKIGVDGDYVERVWQKALSLETRFNPENENDGKIPQESAEKALEELKKAKSDWENRVTREQFIKRWENLLRDEKGWGGPNK